MIQVSPNFPVCTGDNSQDIENIFDYLYKLERELRHELELKDKKIKELEEKLNGR